MQAKKGDRVKVHYTLRLDDGTVVETSAGATPMEFIIGNGEMLQDFECGCIGMNPGESRTITIPAAQAYGTHNEKMVFEFSRSVAPEGFDPQIGQIIRMHRPDGKTFIVTVIGITEKGYMMDANHPLSGKNLTFDVELIEISG